MEQTSLKAILEAKAKRRRRLAALPLEEKVRIIEQLQEMGRTMRAARENLPQGREAAGTPSGASGSIVHG